MVSVLCESGYEDVNEHWFSPAFWGENAVPVSAGGRGSAWFVHSTNEQLVLRHYRRGGLVARVFQQRYLFTGYERTRSFLEFRLLSKLRDKGLPVPKPIAALIRRRGILTYEAAILIERIEGAQPLPGHPAVNDKALWRRVGETIARFHCEGLDHVDLNCDNILVADEGIFLIDFDRCTLHSDTAQSVRWRESNLRRLRRSVEKRLNQFDSSRKDTLWHELLVSYQRTASLGKHNVNAA